MTGKKSIVDGFSAPIEQLDDNALSDYLTALTKLRDVLNDANSSFPATKSFLDARGLSNVSQLDKQGLSDLTDHLKNILSELNRSKN